MVAAAIETPDSVESKLAFGHSVFQIQQVEGLAEGLEPETLGQRLLQEIAQAARDLWLDSFKGRCKVSQKALGPLRGTLNKAKSLTFLEWSLIPVIEGIEAEMGSLPKRGYLEGHDLRVLIGILHTLADLGNFANPVDFIDEPEADLAPQVEDLPEPDTLAEPAMGLPASPVPEVPQEGPRPPQEKGQDEPAGGFPLAASSRTPRPDEPASAPSFWWA
jgi:hypothetical protein